MRVDLVKVQITFLIGQDWTHLYISSLTNFSLWLSNCTVLPRVGGRMGDQDRGRMCS